MYFTNTQVEVSRMIWESEIKLQVYTLWGVSRDPQPTHGAIVVGKLISCGDPPDY